MLGWESFLESTNSDFAEEAMVSFLVDLLPADLNDAEREATDEDSNTSERLTCFGCRFCRLESCDLRELWLVTEDVENTSDSAILGSVAVENILLILESLCGRGGRNSEIVTCPPLCFV